MKRCVAIVVLYVYIDLLRKKKVIIALVTSQMLNSKDKEYLFQEFFYFCDIGIVDGLEEFCILTPF